jgi:hypothetical protein
MLKVMLKTTPSIEYKPTAKAEAKPKPDSKVKFYADCPDGQRNKLFSYPVHDIVHALNLLDRFKEKGFTIRSAYFTNPKGINSQIPL